MSGDITERNRTELGLEDSILERADLERILSLSHELIGIVGMDGSIKYVNPAGERILGFSLQELLAIPFMNLVHQDDRTRTAAEMEKLAQGLETIDFENRYITKDGSVKYLAWTATPMLEQQKVYCVARDITQRRQAEKAMLDSDQQLRLATAATRVAMWNLDLASGDPYFSPEWKAQLGYQDHEIENCLDEWSSRLHPDDREQVLAKVDDYLAGRTPEYVNEFRLRHKDGSYRWIYTRADRQLDDSGRPVRIFGCHVDITESRKTQLALQQSEERYRAIFEKSQNGIIFADTKTHNFRYANSAAARLLGYTQKELCRLGVKDIHPADAMEEVAAEFEAQASGRKIGKTELPCLKKDGTIIHAEISATTVSTSEGEFSVGFFTDRTERRQTEASLRDSEEKFRSFIEQSPTTFELYDTDGFLVQVNRAFENLWNLQADDVVNKFNVLESSQVEEVGLLPYIKRAFAGEEIGAIPDVDFNASREDVDNREKSRERWLSNILYPVRDVQGNVTHVVMMHEDITEQKQAEQKVRDSEEEFRSLIEQSPISIQILNRDGEITKVNQAFQKLWGISDEDLEEVMDTYNTFEDAQVEKLGLLPGIRRAFAGENVILPVEEYDCPETMKNVDLAHVMSNKVWIQARLYPIKNTEGELLKVVYMEEDMTEQRAAEIRLNEYQKRLQALSSQLSVTEERERQRIAGELHDEVGQNLASSRLQLASALKACADPVLAAKLKELSATLLQATRDTRHLVYDLSSPSLNELGLAEAIAERLEEEIQVRHGIETRFEGDEFDCSLSKDINALLFRSVRELLTNVVKHADASRVTVRMQRDDGACRITVEDNGRGFDAGSEVFRAHSGGGFGLFSIRERMEHMGGSFELLTEEGKGCRAVLSMQCPDDDHEPNKY